MGRKIKVKEIKAKDDIMDEAVVAEEISEAPVYEELDKPDLVQSSDAKSDYANHPKFAKFKKGDKN